MGIVKSCIYISDFIYFYFLSLIKERWGDWLGNKLVQFFFISMPIIYIYIYSTQDIFTMIFLGT